jgi:competence protein ComGC
MAQQRGFTFVHVVIALAIVVLLTIALLSRHTPGRGDGEGPPIGQRGYEAEAKLSLQQIRALAYGHYVATGTFPTLDELEAAGWREPSGGVYYYECDPPDYRAIPVPSGPADGLRTITLTLSADGGASVH